MYVIDVYYVKTGSDKITGLMCDKSQMKCIV